MNLLPVMDLSEGENYLMGQSDAKKAFPLDTVPSNSLFKTKRINIMVAGPPVTGKTTIINFLVKFYPLRREGMNDDALLEVVGKSEDLTRQRILPTLGVKVRFLDMNDGEENENQIILWELGRAMSTRPSRAPSDYFRWMQAFIFVCRADNFNSIKSLNDWYERASHEKTDFTHVTFVHMYDLTSSTLTRDFTWNLREELHENLFFTSMKTQQGLLNLLKGLDLILNELL